MSSFLLASLSFVQFQRFALRLPPAHMLVLLTHTGYQRSSPLAPFALLRESLEAWRNYANGTRARSSNNTKRYRGNK